MGYLNDLGTSKVKKIDPTTGYPVDEWGHLLSTTCERDGSVLEGWDKPGTQLYNFTSPYGHLNFCVGTSDDFYCFDYADVDAGPRGKFMILHATVNSETGSFIEGAGYEVMPNNTMKDQQQIVIAAFGMVDQALEYLSYSDKPLKHTVRGWNQQPYYFALAVARNLSPWRFKLKNGKDMPYRKAYAKAFKVATEMAFPTKK